MNENFAAPLSNVFYTNGEITDVDTTRSMATVSYFDKNGNQKTANFKITNDLGYKIGEIVSMQLSDEFVFILKGSGEPLFPP